MTPEISALSPQLRMRSYIQRVATGPELGKSISSEEAQDGMQSILRDLIDPVQSAIYLIALRMKRETDDEFIGSLLGLRSALNSADANVADLIDISDPFDGFVRCVPASTFLPAVLAALDIPALLQGADSIGPKYGVTHRKILQAAGIEVNLSSDLAAKQIENKAFAWAYLDQRQSCPALHDLLPLRTRMVKRSVLTTIETLTRPISAKQTHMMGGFVHRVYPPIYILLARHAGYYSAMVVRGVEGSVLPSLSQVTCYFRYDGNTQSGETEKVRLDPNELAISQTERAMPLPNDLPEPEHQPDQRASSVDTIALAQVAAEMGLAALKGQQGPIYDSLVYGASICLHHLGRVSSWSEAADLSRAALKSGKAYARFTAATN